MNKPRAEQPFPDVEILERHPLRVLRLGPRWVQGAMNMESPDDLVLDYAPRMMGWLLFQDPDTWARRHVLQLGLGAGGLTRFCWRRLGLRTTVVEINPQVISACREWFHLPARGVNLRVLCGDARLKVQQASWRGTVDALQMDAYDDQAERPYLSSLRFYRDCRRLLTPDGCLAINVFGRSSTVEQTCARLTAVFGTGRVWVFPASRGGNVVVLASQGNHQPSARDWRARARLLGPYWGQEPGPWIRGLRAYQPKGTCA